MKHVYNLSSIADKYDVFLFDVFGVLHDGDDLFTTTVEVVDHLTSIGKRVYFLTNSPQRSPFVVEHLRKMGLEKSLYCQIITAGDQVHQFLREATNTALTGLGKTYYFIGTQAMTEIIPPFGYTRTYDLKTADFILAAGPENAQDTVEDYRMLLEQGVSQSLPMICGNPDLYVFHKGVQEVRAGGLAALYESLGGRVHYFGKPQADTYQIALALSGSQKERVLIIGDSLYTDIVGANHANIDSLLSVSDTTFFELRCDDKAVDVNELSKRVTQLKNRHVVPVYFANPVRW